MMRRKLTRQGRELTNRTSVACCGIALVGRAVEVTARRSQPATFRGITRCKAVAVCPDCMVDLQHVRGEGLQAEITTHRARGGEVVLATFTLPHGVGDDLEAIRRRLATSWGKVIQGAPWQRCKAKFAIGHNVRALEVTHGERHGFHPHLHVALLTSRTLADAELAALECVLSERWRKAVTSIRHGGPWPAPHPEHGVRCSRLAGSDYLVKMGLDARELVSSATKAGREGHRTPLQVLAEVMRAHAARDNERKQRFSRVWQAYSRGMFGARWLTYSRGFHQSLGLAPSPPDAQIDLDGCAGDAERVATITAENFNQIRRSPQLLAALKYVPVHFRPGQWKEAVMRLVDAAWGRPPVPF